MLLPCGAAVHGIPHPVAALLACRSLHPGPAGQQIDALVQVPFVLDFPCRPADPQHQRPQSFEQVGVEVPHGASPGPINDLRLDDLRLDSLGQHDRQSGQRLRQRLSVLPLERPVRERFAVEFRMLGVSVERNHVVGSCVHVHTALAPLIAR